MDFDKMKDSLILDDLGDIPLTKENREKMRNWYMGIDLAKPGTDYTIMPVRRKNGH